MTAQRRATTSDAGRACPYCRFALKSGIAVTACVSCGALHHTDCWQDNDGCAIVACGGGRQPATATVAAGVAPDPAPVKAPPRRDGAPPAVATRRRGGTPMIVAAALVIGGAASAVTVVVAGSDDKPGPVAGPSTAQEPAGPQATTADTPTVSVSTVAGPRTATQRSASPPAPPPGAVGRERAIDAAVSGYFSAVRSGRFDRAWRLLSPSYRAWKTRSGGGFVRWQQQEARNRERLRGGDPTVRVQSYDPASGVATLYVSALRFKPEGRPECPYVGVTWARQVAGRWLYDQGYMQNPARAAKWRPRQTETLGSSCDRSGY